jgi:hypothetical protein
MIDFNLPNSTVVNKIIPKKSFDAYTNTKQKRLFTDVVERIKWLNKISTDTTNLHYQELQEIQIFHVTLKLKAEVDNIISIIEKAIPYHIIFVVSVEDAYMLYTSKKHGHVTNEDNAVIDWTFKTDWLMDANKYSLNLKKDIDFVYSDFCNQITGNKEDKPKPLEELIEEENKLKKLRNKILKLEKAIKREKQFNKKVELNDKLQKLNEELYLINRN